MARLGFAMYSILHRAGIIIQHNNYSDPSFSGPRKNNIKYRPRITIIM